MSPRSRPHGRSEAPGGGPHCPSHRTSSGPADAGEGLLLGSTASRHEDSRFVVHCKNRIGCRLLHKGHLGKSGPGLESCLEVVSWTASPDVVLAHLAGRRWTRLQPTASMVEDIVASICWCRRRHLKQHCFSHPMRSRSRAIQQLQVWVQTPQNHRSALRFEGWYSTIFVSIGVSGRNHPMTQHRILSNLFGIALRQGNDWTPAEPRLVLLLVRLNVGVDHLLIFLHDDSPRDFTVHGFPLLSRHWGKIRRTISLLVIRAVGGSRFIKQLRSQSPESMHRLWSGIGWQPSHPSSGR